MSTQQIFYDSFSNGNNYEKVSIISKNNLEDFIYELKQRNDEETSSSSGNICRQNLKEMGLNIVNDTMTNNNHHHNNNNNNNDQYNQDSLLHDTNVLMARLAKKEKDLILAAELGKALLDRNEELSRTNEQLNEEYTRNIELLEQEKYALRKKLNSIEIEYENKIHDLQADLKSTKENLNAHFEISKQNETENNRIITELSEQNRRLTLELKESSNRESLLEKEIQSLKEQFSARRTNFSEHIGHLESLRDEINLLSNRKRELENKITSLNEEKVSISITLDESEYKILALEKKLQDKELNLQNQQKDLEELRRMNIHYQNKIDSLMKIKTFDFGTQQVSSLYNEIEISSHSSCDENNHHHHHQPVYFSEEEIDMFTIENNCHRCFKSKQEIGDFYNKLKQLCDDLYKRQRQSDAINSNQVNVSSNSNHDSGIQTNLGLIDELNMIFCDIQDLIKNIDFMQCSSCQQFNLERNELERLHKKSKQDKEEIVRLNSQIIKLSSDVTMREAELKTLKERCKILEEDHTVNIKDMTQDEIVRRALKIRDETISRKNVAEIELAKARIELMHVNSQLLETIQQKVELSQQLEQWQVDMEILIEEQLKNKLSLQEKKNFDNNINGNKKENLFGLINFSKLLNYQR